MMIREVKTFTIIVLQTMIYYYGGVLAKKMQENPSQMYDFVLDKIISKDLHDLLIHSYDLAHLSDYADYKKKFETFSNISCSDLQIEPLFCLDKLVASGNGYEYAIDRLKSIVDALTPIKKLELISQTTDLICKCVDDHWRCDTSIDPNKLIIDGDQFLSIYIYIVIKSGVYNLKSHIYIISELSRSGMQNGAMGYYMTTLEACLIQVATLNI
jgi:Vacuolar sorting protein 9 (VPS9) domain